MADRTSALDVKSITISDLDNLFQDYGDIAHKLANLMRTGKVGVFLIHYSYINNNLPDEIKKNKKYDIFEILAFIFVKQITNRIQQYKHGEISTERLEEALRGSIRTWCVKNKLPVLASLDKLKLHK